MTMTRHALTELESKFPFEEDFIDFSGGVRRFLISLDKQIVKSFFLRAQELSRPTGYHFEVYSTAYSAAALGSALSKLRRKISKELSTRHLYVDSEGKTQLTHDELSGHISYGGIVVDGHLLKFQELERILQTHEGFEIHIKISWSSE
jgi:hypothetical protein